MAKRTVSVGVIAVLRRPSSRWAEAAYAPGAVLDAAPDVAPGTPLGAPPGTSAGSQGGAEAVYAGPAEIALHSGETGHYRDNLSGHPSVWVAFTAGAAAPRIVAATVNPHEGEALAGDDGLLVEAVAMPPLLRAAVEAFFAEHHVEVAFEKRKRRRADPEALARRGPQGGDDGR